MSNAKSAVFASHVVGSRSHGLLRGVVCGALLLVLSSSALAQNGTVTGTVTNQATSAPATSGSVVLCSATSCFGFSLTTAGVYTANVSPDTYYAYTSVSSSLNLVNEIYDNIQCVGFCSSTTARSTGTAIAVTIGSTLTRNFALAPGGSVAGTVTDANSNAPLQNTSVTVYTRVGTSTTFAGSTTTSASGTYSVGGLLTGTYFAFTSGGSNINEIYNDIPCFGPCSATAAVDTGTAIAVTTGAVTGSINFALALGGVVAGTVTDSSTGAPLQSVNLNVYTLVGTSTTFMGSASSSSSGAYSIGGLPTGTYFAFTTSSPSGNYTNEIYNDILCTGSCNTNVAVNSGAPIAVAVGATTGGIHFALAPAGKVSGRVRNAVTSAAFQNVAVRAYARVGLTVTGFASGTTDASGNYTIGSLPNGTYYLATNTGLAINEIYNNISCDGSCSSIDAVNLGQPVPVMQGSTTAGADFDLDMGGSIAGTTTDAGTAAVVPFTTVQVYRQVGTSTAFVTSGFSDGVGVYSVAGLTTGTYFAVAFPSSPYVSEVFGGPQCLGCSSAQILAGTPIAVTTGVATSGQNFALDLGGTITGIVINSATSAPLSNRTVLLPVGSSTFGFATNAAGVFKMTGLPPGVYRVGTQVGQFANQAYNNVACPAGTCAFSFITASGTPISVTAGATVTGINFALDPLSTAPGAPFNVTTNTTATGIDVTWSAPSSGGVATSYILQGGVTPGGTLATLPTATTSITLPLLGPGTYYLRIKGINAFGTGPASPELTLIVGAGGAVTPQPPTNLLAWTAGGRLTFTWSAPTTGAVPTDYMLEAGSAVGLSNLAVVPVSGRAFTFDPVPAGFFFLRVRSRVGGVVSVPSPDVMINVGNVPAPPSPPQNFFSSVSSGTVTFTWTAPLLGTPLSYVLEAGTAPGLSNITVFNTGSAATTFVVPGVPSGTYYVRLSAANAQGVSPVSNERTVIVP